MLKSGFKNLVITAIKALILILWRPQMARIKLPSYIKEGHGRMEDAVIVTRDGYSYMKTYRRYDRGSSPKQMEVRQAFSSVVADWKYLKGIIRESWDIMAEGRRGTGYSTFIGENISRRRAGEPLMLCPGNGEELVMNLTAVPDAAPGGIVCMFLSAEPGCHVTFFTRQEAEPGKKGIITRHDAGADPCSPFTIKGLEPGAKYNVWAVVTDSVYEEAVTVSASVSAVSTAG